MTPPRQALPARRRSVTDCITWRGQAFTVCVGFDAAGRAREVFGDGQREGSDLAALIDDACILISVALQHDLPPEVLAKSLGTVPEWRDGGLVDGPASILGALLTVVTAAALPPLPESLA
jgi:hypothetical protein